MSNNFEYLANLFGELTRKIQELIVSGNEILKQFKNDQEDKAYVFLEKQSVSFKEWEAANEELNVAKQNLRESERELLKKFISESTSEFSNLTKVEKVLFDAVADFKQHLKKLISCFQEIDVFLTKNHDLATQKVHDLRVQMSRLERNQKFVLKTPRGDSISQLA